MSIESTSPKSKRAAPRQRSIKPIGLSISESVAASGLSRPMLYRMMSAGKLRYVQVGRTRRIPSSEFVRLGFDTPTT
jgi:excisionase family DNA binding protein